jgi:hypothetical protein
VSEIHPADLAANPGLAARYLRRDDLLRDIVNVRARQDRAIQDLGLKSPPSLPRLRQANETRAGFAELFADLQIEPPTARTDGNAMGERIAHLELLKHHCARWAKADLGRLAQADARGFDNAQADIIRDAQVVAADPTIGSFKHPGALRPVVRTDKAGHKTTTWHGDPNAWMSHFHDPLLRCLTAVGDGRGNWYPR